MDCKNPGGTDWHKHCRYRPNPGNPWERIGSIIPASGLYFPYFILSAAASGIYT
jgi:hypothetical protein